MTNDSGNDNLSNDLSEIANVVGELPANVLEALKNLPPEFINQLSQLSPEAVDQLTRLPIDMLAGLAGMPSEMLEWLGRASSRSESGLSPEVLAQFIKVGHFSLLFLVIPEAAVLPILVFIGIEITAQSFVATPKRHYAALAIACLPAITGAWRSVGGGMFQHPHQSFPIRRDRLTRPDLGPAELVPLVGGRASRLP